MLKDQEYTIIIEPQREGNEKWYVAYAKELGKYSCYGLGDTPEEAIADFEQAKKDFLQLLKKEDKPIPSPRSSHSYSGIFTVRTSKTLHSILAEQAEEEGISLNALVNQFLSFGAGMKSFDSKTANKLDSLENTIQSLYHSIKYMDPESIFNSIKALDTQNKNASFFLINNNEELEVA
ncbi:MAG: type II toxin-antitoxin system HicB family antitoxin [Chlorobi bacterium]|nr:type II toxin-antitoxin system HicB family antitoxin [Chlorobiota bacterium]